MSDQDNRANDYALAKYLDERVAAIFALVADYHHNLPDLKALNRTYVLLVNELKQLYQRNPELSAIGENICWRTFESIDAIDPHDLYEYSDDYANHGVAHISKVNSLCIVAGKETPTIEPALKKILDEADETVMAFIAEMDSMNPEVRDWYIPQYTVTYRYGAITINGVLKLTKSHDGSALDELMQQVVDKPNELFRPTLNSTKTLSSIISNAGFTSALREIFFPVVGKSRGVLFRPVVTHEQVLSDKVDTTKLDQQLKELGADTKQIILH